MPVVCEVHYYQRATKLGDYLTILLHCNGFAGEMSFVLCWSTISHTFGEVIHLCVVVVLVVSVFLFVALFVVFPFFSCFCHILCSACVVSIPYRRGPFISCSFGVSGCYSVGRTHVRGLSYFVFSLVVSFDRRYHCHGLI